MALKLIANYSKRLGLPGYSSHQFSVCVETEIGSIEDVGDESNRLYHTLQRSVDHEIQRTGFVPQGGYGTALTNGKSPQNGSSLNGHWQCSEKQQDLILKLIDDNQLDKAEVESLANQHFNRGVKELDRKQASTFIDELFVMIASRSASTNRSRNGATPAHSRGGGR